MSEFIYLGWIVFPLVSVSSLVWPEWPMFLVTNKPSVPVSIFCWSLEFCVSPEVLCANLVSGVLGFWEFVRSLRLWVPPWSLVEQGCFRALYTWEASGVTGTNVASSRVKASSGVLGWDMEIRRRGIIGGQWGWPQRSAMGQWAGSYLVFGVPISSSRAGAFCWCFVPGLMADSWGHV